MYDQLPSKLKKRPHFCNWKKEQQNERMTKVPYRTNGKRANPTDPECFTDFDTVCTVRKEYDGIGIGISNTAPTNGKSGALGKPSSRMPKVSTPSASRNLTVTLMCSTVATAPCTWSPWRLLPMIRKIA